MRIFSCRGDRQVAPSIPFWQSPQGEPPLAPTIIILLFFLFLSSCTSNEIKPNAAPVASSDELPSQTSAHTRMSFSSGGKIRAVMNARGVRTFEQKRYTILDSSVHVDFFDRDANHSSLLTSHRAFIDDNSHNMTAYDSVRILSDSGTLVETDSLVWDNTTHKLHSDAFVRITEKTGRITKGHGFESDQDLVNYKILQPIIDAPTNTLENHNPAPAFSTPTQNLGMPPPMPLPPPEQKKDTGAKKSKL
ncbi:MAG: LPS export ABC transporter periplasmic protein LptC [Candidatus Kapaibacterium sp.]